MKTNESEHKLKRVDGATDRPCVEVTTLVHDLDKGMVPLSVFFPYAPIEAHRKRDKVGSCHTQYGCLAKIKNALDNPPVVALLSINKMVALSVNLCVDDRRVTTTQARKDLAAIFDKVIQSRRESGTSEPDVLQTFIDARYKVRDVSIFTPRLKKASTRRLRHPTLTTTRALLKKKPKKTSRL